MKKITIKHFLNTNLKPYQVRGERYFTVYILITVNRKTTKVKSKEFQEMYTEIEFDHFLSPENENNKYIIFEEKLIHNIIKSQLEIDGNTFDTNLFSAFYNLMPNYYVSESETFKKVLHWGLGIDSGTMENIFFHNDTDRQAGISFYDWYSDHFQHEIERFLKKKKKAFNIEQLNIAAMHSFFDILGILSDSIRKYESLKKRYPLYFYSYVANGIRAISKEQANKYEDFLNDPKSYY